MGSFGAGVSGSTEEDAVTTVSGLTGASTSNKDSSESPNTVVTHMSDVGVSFFSVGDPSTDTTDSTGKGGITDGVASASSSSKVRFCFDYLNP
jgi:hypothetical protein